MTREFIISFCATAVAVVAIVAAVVTGTAESKRGDRCCGLVTTILRDAVECSERPGCVVTAHRFYADPRVPAVLGCKCTHPNNSFETEF